MNNTVTAHLNQIVKRFPDKTAFSDNKGRITFDELKKKAMSIAASVCDQSIWHRPIMVFMDKSIECICSFYGVAYSGNFYTPVDTKMPIERINKIYQTLLPAAIITTRQFEGICRKSFEDALILIYEEIQSNDYAYDYVEELQDKIVDTDVLYVLFTSGSTGVPKGVIIPHRSVMDYIEWLSDSFPISEKNIIGNQAPLYFDLSIQDVYLPVITGCEVVLLNQELFYAPPQLMMFMADKMIDTIFWVPTALCLVANMKGLQVKKLPRLSGVFFCGEVMPNKQLNEWRKVFSEAVFVNMYGPTEACDASTYYIIDREFSDSEMLPIGKPCRNTGILILNKEDELIRDDETGELCIYGSSLAYGYYNDEINTRKAFVQNPLNRKYPEIIYKTGDLVRKNEFGELMFVSRKDYQIKHKGYRIELGEIETAISSLDGILLNCCLYDEKEKNIVVIYSGNIGKDEIDHKLHDLLPLYMIPGVYIRDEHIKTNLNGKIDRQYYKQQLDDGQLVLN